MKYISIDLETTSLIPDPDHILQISMVLEHTANRLPILDLPHFTCFISRNEYKGEAYAISMNGWIFDHISGRSKNLSPYPIIEQYYWQAKAIEWLASVGFDRTKDRQVIAAGKNVGQFDMQFLPDSLKRLFKPGVIDPTSMYIDWSKDKLPGLQDCLKANGMHGPVTHDAYLDAIDVIRVLRKFY